MKKNIIILLIFVFIFCMFNIYGYDATNDAQANKILDGQINDLSSDIMNKLDTERIKYDIFKFKHNKRQALWHNISTILIFFVVIGIVITGLIFSALQFRIAMKHFKDGKDIQGISDSDLSISKEGLKVKSSVLGVIILVISLAFFYLYLVYVYPLHVVDDSSTAPQKTEKNIE